MGVESVAAARDAVVVEGLTVVRGGHTVFRDLSCSIPAGSITGLIGPSGCGKSTLIRSFVGVQTLTAGRVTVLGLPAGSPGVRRRVGYATQSPAIYADLTVAENLSYFAAVLGVDREAIERTLLAVGLTENRHQLTRNLSGGQLSRVSLAVALLGAPQLLVLDEPTVGLDPLLRDELWELFRRLAAEGATLLVSSHVMDEAERCPSLILMRNGRIIAQDTPSALRARTGTASLDDAFLHLVRSTLEEALA